MLTQPIRPTKTYKHTITDSERWQAFRARVGDIVVTTPPKSGTTWTQSILAMLITGDPDVDANTSMKSPWIDFSLRDLDEVMARIEAQEHRRQLKSHTPRNGIPVWPDLRYITVYRHPIDVYFSFRKHAANQIREISRTYFPEEYFDEDPSPGFRVFLESDLVDSASLQFIVRHYQSTMDFEPRENILRLHYADMLRDLPGAFARISAHTGLVHPPELVDRMITAATFDNMKANAHRYTPSAGAGTWQDDSAFFDSASSNKWVGRLSEAELAAYDARMAELLPEGPRRWLEQGSAGSPA
jgi:aryl sulfotransferase